MDREAPTVDRATLLANTPDSIRKSLPDVPWRLQALHALRLPVTSVPVADLAWVLDLPLWQLDGKRFQVRPYDVEGSPSRYPHHYARVMRVNLAYPIHLARHTCRLAVLDGAHRLLRAKIEGRDTIESMILRDDDLRAISTKP